MVAVVPVVAVYLGVPAGQLASSHQPSPFRFSHFYWKRETGDLEDTSHSMLSQSGPEAETQMSVCTTYIRSRYLHNIL